MPQEYVLLQIRFLTGVNPLDSHFVVESAARNAARKSHHHNSAFVIVAGSAYDRYQNQNSFM